AAVLTPPDGRGPVWASARHPRERHHVDGIGVVWMYDDREPEVRRETLRDRAPGLAVVVAAQHANVRPPPAGPVPLPPAAVVLHVDPAGRFLVAGVLRHALAELGIGIRGKAGADALIPRLKGLAAVFRQVMAARRDAEVNAFAVTQDGVHAEPAV